MVKESYLSDLHGYLNEERTLDVYKTKNHSSKTSLPQASTQTSPCSILHYYSSLLSYTQFLWSLLGMRSFGKQQTTGILPPSSELNCRSGAALQMQRELQWYKAVERNVHPRCKEELNIDNKKPLELFVKNHEDLLKEGEKWVKNTATSFTIVGSLITIIMFAAVFAVSGGSHLEIGIPILLRNWKFTIFVICDAVSLCCSTTSVLIFLGILISWYVAEDFLVASPTSLFWGRLSLVVSFASMIIAFVATLSTMLHDNYLSIVIVAIIFASAPIIIFVTKQYHLVSDIYSATYSSTILADRKMKMWR